MRAAYSFFLAGMITAIFMVLAAGGVARAADSDCWGYYGPLSEVSKSSLGRISAGVARTYFVKNGSDAKGCPNATDACRAKAFLVPGDRVILKQTVGAFVCADFIGTKRIQSRPGWLPASAIVPETPPPITLADWLGKWSQVEATITFKPGSKAGTLSISGDATWGSLDPERVKLGAIHVGNIEGTTSPNGADLSFAMGENGTLPVDKGGESDCKVWMRRLGPYLLVSDNNNCGGMNVSFSGIYSRNAAPPQGRAKVR
jgi:hypothetical protein